MNLFSRLGFKKENNPVSVQTKVKVVEQKKGNGYSLKLEESNYPNHKILPLIPSVDDIIKEYKNKVEKSHYYLPYPDDQLDKYFYSPLRKFIRYVGNLPASENHHHACEYGLLTHTLDVIRIALTHQARKPIPRRKEDGTKDRMKQKQYMKADSYMIFAEALVHDIGKVFDMEIIDSRFNIWNPYRMPLLDWIDQGERGQIMFRWDERRNLPGKYNHEVKGLWFIERLFDADILQDFNMDFMVDIFEYLGSHAKSDRCLGYGIILNADKQSCAEYLKNKTDLDKLHFSESVEDDFALMSSEEKNAIYNEVLELLEKVVSLRILDNTYNCVELDVIIKECLDIKDKHSKILTRIEHSIDPKVKESYHEELLKEMSKYLDDDHSFKMIIHLITNDQLNLEYYISVKHEHGKELADGCIRGKIGWEKEVTKDPSSVSSVPKPVVKKTIPPKDPSSPKPKVIPPKEPTPVQPVIKEPAPIETKITITVPQIPLKGETSIANQIKDNSKVNDSSIKYPDEYNEFEDEKKNKTKESPSHPDTYFDVVAPSLKMSYPFIGREDRYEVGENIGEGSFGIVVEAFDSKIQRKVALKVLKDDATDDTIERFKKESITMAKFNHSNVVQIFDSEFDNKRNRYFISMELMEGGSLHTKIEQDGGHSVKDAIKLLKPIARALLFGHSHQDENKKITPIIHRDIKPANILLTKDNVTKISDFGLAMISSLEISKSGHKVGTESYMAPEQRLDPKNVDCRCDIYAFGKVLYCLITGENPIGAEDEKNRTEKCGEVAKIIEKCIRYKKEDRYNSFRGILEDFTLIENSKKPSLQGELSRIEKSKALGSKVIEIKEEFETANPPVLKVETPITPVHNVLNTPVVSVEPPILPVETPKIQEHVDEDLQASKNAIIPDTRENAFKIKDNRKSKIELYKKERGLSGDHQSDFDLKPLDFEEEFLLAFKEVVERKIIIMHERSGDLWVGTHYTMITVPNGFRKIYKARAIQIKGAIPGNPKIDDHNDTAIASFLNNYGVVFNGITNDHQAKSAWACYISPTGFKYLNGGVGGWFASPMSVIFIENKWLWSKCPELMPKPEMVKVRVGFYKKSKNGEDGDKNWCKLMDFPFFVQNEEDQLVLDTIMGKYDDKDALDFTKKSCEWLLNEMIELFRRCIIPSNGKSQVWFDKKYLMFVYPKIVEVMSEMDAYKMHKWPKNFSIYNNTILSHLLKDERILVINNVEVQHTIGISFGNGKSISIRGIILPRTEALNTLCAKAFSLKKPVADFEFTRRALAVEEGQGETPDVHNEAPDVPPKKPNTQANQANVPPKKPIAPAKQVNVPSKKPVVMNEKSGDYV